MRRAHLAITAFALAATSCRHDAQPNRSRASVVQQTAGAIVARVGNDVITVDDVQATARDEGIADVHAALERTIAIRLEAREAMRRRLDSDPLVIDLARRAALQSLLAQTIEREVTRDRLPAADLEAGMRIRGFDLAHGELWHTTHALIPVAADASEAARNEARANAEHIRDAVRALPEPRTIEQFRAVANGVANAHPRVEDLPGFDATGAFGRGSMVEPFVRAATALASAGDVSDVVETPFGYHVIMLVERLPPVTRPESEVRAAVENELLWRLRHTALEHYLEQLRAQYHTAVRDEALHVVDTMPLETRSASEGEGS